MKKITVFTHSLDLALRLVDTTSGTAVSGGSIEAYLDGSRVRFEEKGGVLIFQKLPARQFQLELRSPYYEPEAREIDLDAMTGMPLLEQHLIPSAGYPGGTELLTLEGSLPGIDSLTAVRAGDNACMIRAFDPRKRLMTIFNPHHLALERVHYALVDPDSGRYEPFDIVKRTDDRTVKADRVPEMEFRNYFPITPLVLGKCGGDGDYCLRVRDDGSQARWIVRWEVDGTPYFRTLDFREDAHPHLEGGG